MKANVGTVDRLLRIVAGAALMLLTLTQVIGPWGWIGIVPVLTGVFRFCPAYSLLGVFDKALSDPVRFGVSLSESIASGDWRLHFLRRDRIEKATLADLQRSCSLLHGEGEVGVHFA